MGARNYLVEGVSCTGKTSVCHELERRGLQAFHGDRELAYNGDPQSGQPTERRGHEYHLWDVGKVRAMVADQGAPVTFFCGGSRNFTPFIDLFDGVFVLQIDTDTLRRRLDTRPAEEFGGRPEQRALVERLHRTQEDVPRDGIPIDATAPVSDVVDEILRHVGSPGQAGRPSSR